MPEEQDSISETLAMAQQANALLNSIRREQPDLWQKVLLLPNGLRAAMPSANQPKGENTIVLVSHGSTKQGYAVDSKYEAVELSHAELVKQVECAPSTKALPLPSDTNTRVSAASAAMIGNQARPSPLEPRAKDDQVVRYINQNIGQMRLGHQDTPGFLQHLETLRRAFNGELPNSVNQRIRDMQHNNIEGDTLIKELTEMLGDLPKPSEDQQSQQPPTRQSEVICSMGIIQSG